MSQTPAIARPASALPPVAAPSRAASADPVAEGDGAFAKLLDQQRNAPRPSTQPVQPVEPEPPVSAAPSDTPSPSQPVKAPPAPGSDKDDSDQRTIKTQAAPPTKPRQPPVQPGGSHPARTDKTTTVEGDAGPAPVCGAATGDEDTAATAATAKTDGDKSPLIPNDCDMPAMPLTPAAPATAAQQNTRSGRRNAPEDDSLAPADTRSRVAVSPRDGGTPDKGQADGETPAVRAAAEKTAASPPAGSRADIAAAQAEARVTPSGATATPDAASAMGAAAAASLPGTTPAAAPAAAEAALPARPDSPVFASQLGAQISTWVHDGVQEARLQLNPAEMGPVLVKIELDGVAAQVSFSALHAATREALEAAMPTLAYSLSEAGLTLAGGGVFEQAPKREQSDVRQQSGPTRHVPGSDPVALTAAAPARSARPRGVVDLVA